MEQGCVKTYVWDQGQGAGVICLQFLLESLLLIFNKYYLSTYLLHADCAPLTDGYFLYLFFFSIPPNDALYVPYSLTHKEMEAHRD